MATHDPTTTCFVIMPYGTNTDAAGETMRFDVVYKSIIKKGVNPTGLTCVRSDELDQAGSIHHQMFQHILQDAAAVVDITWLNPNVFYELGIRHALRRNVTVLIRKKGTTPPFNISGMRVIDYGLEVDAADEAAERIRRAIEEGLKTGRNDSRVYDVFPNLRLELTEG
jgi:hypothetical protein